MMRVSTSESFGRLVSHYLQCYITYRRTKIGTTVDLLSELCKLEVNRVPTLKCRGKTKKKPEPRIP